MICNEKKKTKKKKNDRFYLKYVSPPLLCLNVLENTEKDGEQKRKRNSRVEPAVQIPQQLQQHQPITAAASDANLFEWATQMRQKFEKLENSDLSLRYQHDEQDQIHTKKLVLLQETCEFLRERQSYFLPEKTLAHQQQQQQHPKFIRQTTRTSSSFGFSRSKSSLNDLTSSGSVQEYDEPQVGALSPDETVRILYADQAYRSGVEIATAKTLLRFFCGKKVNDAAGKLFKAVRGFHQGLVCFFLCPAMAFIYLAQDDNEYLSFGVALPVLIWCTIFVCVQTTLFSNFSIAVRVAKTFECSYALYTYFLAAWALTFCVELKVFVATFVPFFLWNLQSFFLVLIETNI